MKTRREYEFETKKAWAEIHASDAKIKKQSEDYWHGPAKRTVSNEEISERALSMPGRGPGISNEGWWRPAGAYAYYNDKRESAPNSGLTNRHGQWIGETTDSLRVKMERE